MSRAGMVTLGRISGVFGVKGWVKIYSHAQHREEILDYKPWFLRLENKWKPFKLLDGQVQGKGIIALLEGIQDREQALTLKDCDIAVPRECLPALGKNEYYWSDLVGMRVVTVRQVELGIVDFLIETGSNDVLIVQGERERLIPWIMDAVIKGVSLADKCITVDWEPDF